MYGTQANHFSGNNIDMFENDVKMYGTQAAVGYCDDFADV